MERLTLVTAMQTASAATFALVLSLPGGFAPGTVTTFPTQGVHENFYDPWVRLPEFTPQPITRVQRTARDLLALTGWSHRRLARLLNVSHPTVAALVEGRSTGSTADISNRLLAAHSVIKRVNMLVDRDPAETSRVMDVTSPTTDHTPAELLAEGHVTESLLAAIDVIQPQRQTTSLMTGAWPARPGEGTHDPAQD